MQLTLAIVLAVMCFLLGAIATLLFRHAASATLDYIFPGTTGRAAALVLSIAFAAGAAYFTVDYVNGDTAARLDRSAVPTAEFLVPRPQSIVGPKSGPFCGSFTNLPSGHKLWLATHPESRHDDRWAPMDAPLDTDGHHWSTGMPIYIGITNGAANYGDVYRVVVWDASPDAIFELASHAQRPQSTSKYNRYDEMQRPAGAKPLASIFVERGAESAGVGRC